MIDRGIVCEPSDTLSKPFPRFHPRRTRDNLREPLELSICIRIPPIHYVPDEMHSIFQAAPTS